jgi:hypothetical protein
MAAYIVCNVFLRGWQVFITTAIVEAASEHGALARDAELPPGEGWKLMKRNAQEAKGWVYQPESEEV